MLTNEIRQKLAFLTFDGITSWQPHPSEMNNLKFKVPPYFCLVRSVLTSKANSSASASSSSVILTEGDLRNRPVLVRAESRLKYRAICCSVNQSVLENIFWPVSSLELFILGAISEAVAFLPVSSPVQNTFARQFFALWKKATAFRVFRRAHPRSTWVTKFKCDSNSLSPRKQNYMLSNYWLFFKILSWGLTVNLATTYGMDSLYPFLLDLVVGEFFCQL